MCPQCDKYCPFWHLVDSCFLSQVTYLFDNGATVAFAIFMSFWGANSLETELVSRICMMVTSAATMFLEFWKRRQSVLSWEWDLTNFEEHEQPRPEYELRVKTTRINPVTKKREPFLPMWNKAGRVAFTSSFVLFMVSKLRRIEKQRRFMWKVT